MISMQGSHPPSQLFYGHHHRFDNPRNAMATDVFAQQSPMPRRKRKAESQESDRLHKRLSLLNLERNGQKLYVPVENNTSAAAINGHHNPRTPAAARQDEQYMQVDDTKHKVYIYNLDDELSSSESEAEDGKLLFLPDIEKHLFANRIPPIIKANPQGEYAGVNLADKQLVLYSVPTSLTVEPERDSVRKAIIEARQRMREKQMGAASQPGQDVHNNVTRSIDTIPNGHPVQAYQPLEVAQQPYDPDAMDLDP